MNKLTWDMAKKAETTENKVMRSLLVLQFIKQFDPLEKISVIKSYTKRKYNESLGFNGWLFVMNQWGSIRYLLAAWRIGAYIHDKERSIHLKQLKQIYGQNSLEVINICLQFGQIEEQCWNYQNANKYYQMVHEYLKNNSEPGLEALQYRIELEETKLLFKTSACTEETLKTLERVEKYMKSKQKINMHYAYVAKLLQAEYHLIYAKDQQKFKSLYKQAKDMAKLNGIPTNNEFSGECEFRMWTHQLKCSKSAEERRKILETDLKEVFSNSGKYLEWQDAFERAQFYWNQCRKNGLNCPKYKTNDLVSKIELSGQESSQEMDFLKNQLKFKILTSFEMKSNGDLGCKQIFTAKWPGLKFIYLTKSNITDSGCQFLAKTEMPQLDTLELAKNLISDKGCKYLAEGNWPHLSLLNLQLNQITDQGCLYITKANFTRMYEIDFTETQLSDKGCQYIVEANWPNLHRLYIGRCYNITQEGFKAITKGNWPLLYTLHIQQSSYYQDRKYIKIFEDIFPDVHRDLSLKWGT